MIHPPSSHAQKRVYPPPALRQTFVAGAAAGALSSLGSAVPDALSTRVKVDQMLYQTPSGETKVQNLWTWSAKKLQEIGVRGVFRGFGLACAKDALGYGIFFSTFEAVKAQGYYRFLRWWYGGHGPGAVDWKQQSVGQVTKPHWTLEPAFLGLAGVSASLGQQLVVHPLSRVQEILQRGLTSPKARSGRSLSFLQESRSVYIRLAGTVSRRASRAGGYALWLYRGFWWSAVRQVPSTAAGLIIFELVRKRYAEPAPPGEALRFRVHGQEVELG